MFDTLKLLFIDEKIPTDIPNISEWDIAKSECVYRLLLQRNSTEEKISVSLRSRSIFMLSALGVTITILFTFLGSTLQSIASWKDEQQGVLIVVLLCFAIAIIAYFLLYQKFTHPHHRFPDNTEIANIFTKNTLTKEGILNEQIKGLYWHIIEIHQKNLRCNLFFRFTDLIYCGGITIGLLYVLFTTSFSPLVYLIILGSLIGIIYVIMIYGIIRDGIRFISFVKKYKEMKQLKKKEEEAKKEMDENKLIIENIGK